MKKALTSAALLFALAGAAQAEGDAAAGEKDFKKCKACHTVVSPEGDVIFKGGKTGPNLYGVVGRQIASVEGFKYGASIAALGETGAVWTEDLLAAYIMDPKGFLKEQLGDGKAKSKMTFKWKKPENIIAYLASVAPAMEAPAEEAAEEAAEGESTTTN
ncbi:cytochrome C [Aliiroseovarius crassostreae]|uniref:Cytochrome C n=1 Tax=Aliiroseovarius crassostreae TaxID=154981 RepID=A0A9Q9HC52_9RHOB|nr:cytochrome C [Aliiroseovarius crassostreae]UWP88247.1 cytochrome C [Aliiroseovarius crassostreae]UWP91406.1 cytochrome C [Aliiroseovarius crassostreae]UWP94582.1 cytochrome C [Aliiroseovarius crassostreae]UWP97725.1 cytochrome C [Aliiroseovarius crassostreae]